ncbi:MAG: hypothetical protein ACO3KD_08145 [Gaiellales bacterium]
MAGRLMRVDRLDDGLWRWTAPQSGSGREGNSVYHEAPDGITLIDPLLPDDPEQAERFWRALDRDVERIGTSPLIALTDPERQPGAAAVRSRYAGSRILAPGATDTADGTLADGDVLPGGLIAIGPTDAAGCALLGCACHGLIWTGSLLEGDPSPCTPLLPRLVALGPRFLVARMGEPVVEDAVGALARALA